MNATVHDLAGKRILITGGSSGIGLAVAEQLSRSGANLVQLPLGALARLGWRARGNRPPSQEDALLTSTRSAERSGGLHSRPSLLQRLRELISVQP